MLCLIAWFLLVHVDLKRKCSPLLLSFHPSRFSYCIPSRLGVVSHCLLVAAAVHFFPDGVGGCWRGHGEEPGVLPSWQPAAIL